MAEIKRMKVVIFQEIAFAIILAQIDFGAKCPRLQTFKIRIKTVPGFISQTGNANFMKADFLFYCIRDNYYYSLFCNIIVLYFVIKDVFYIFVCSYVLIVPTVGNKLYRLIELCCKDIVIQYIVQENYAVFRH